MGTKEIIHEIQQLPITKQIYIAEWILKSYRHQEKKSKMEIAAEKLYNDYLNDSELTIFTHLDFDHFYEATV